MCPLVQEDKQRGLLEEELIPGLGWETQVSGVYLAGPERARPQVIKMRSPHYCCILGYGWFTASPN